MKDYLINSITPQQFDLLQPAMKEEIQRLRREMGAYDPDIADIWQEVDEEAYKKAMKQAMKHIDENIHKDDWAAKQKPYDLITTHAGGVHVVSDRNRRKNSDYQTIAHVSEQYGIKWIFPLAEHDAKVRKYVQDLFDSLTTETCQILDSEGKPDISPAAIEKFEKCAENLPQTKVKHVDAKGVYTKARKKLHDSIIAKFKKDKTCVTQRKPVAILTGGPPGSGKSTWLKKYLPWATKDRVYHIDADEVRAMLPEYKGWNATSTHAEAKDIVTRLIDEIGDPCEYDLIYDGTMNKAKSYEPLIEQFRRLGYLIFIIYIKVPKAVSQQRVLERYRKSGRYVPKHVIDEVYERGLDAFEKLAKEADGYIMVDGETGKILEKGGMEMPSEERYLANAQQKAPAAKPKAPARIFKSGDYVKLKRPTADWIHDYKGVISGTVTSKIDPKKPSLLYVKLDSGQVVNLLQENWESTPKPKRTVKHTPAGKAKQSQKGAEGYLKSELTKAERGDYRNLSTAQLVAKARAFQAARQKSGAARDEKGDSKQRLSLTPENLVRWMKNPGKFDLVGIDTYKKDDPTADLKIAKQNWWARLGIKL